jgi:hypothetical protein
MTTIHQCIINDLINYANKNKDGFTIQLKEGLFNFIDIVPVIPDGNHRYVFAFKELIVIQNFYEKTEREINNPKILKTIKQCYVIHPGLFEKLKNISYDNIFIGGYYSERDNNYYIEFIKLHASRVNAICEGKKLNQYSIYDLIDKKELVVKDEMSKCHFYTDGI